MRTETLIVGAGLSGLSMAAQLQAQGRDYLLVEARSRIGGRIETLSRAGGQFDLGPAWFWAGQPRLARLLEALGLGWFEQYSQGLMTVEAAQGPVQTGPGLGAMAGSFRVQGGLSAVTEGLAAGVPLSRLRLATPVLALDRSAEGCVATLGDGTQVAAAQVILAMPPRLAAQIAFTPGLPDATMAALNGVATWMAGQAKAIAVYERPFWRAAGLSGDAMSRRGPMVEIHDASPAMGGATAASGTGGPHGLFGFLGVPPEARRDQARLSQAVRDQFSRLFGAPAEAPLSLHIKDWALDPWTATSADLAPFTAHPRYGLPPDLQDLWEGRLQFSGTETAPEFGGFLEGALEAGQNTLQRLRF